MLPKVAGARLPSNVRCAVAFAIPLLAAAQASASDNAQLDRAAIPGPRPPDYCASLNGSNWKDIDGHAIFINGATFTYIGAQGDYADSSFSCSNNTLAIRKADGTTSTARVSADGTTIMLGPVEHQIQWQLVFLPKDCLFGDQRIPNGNKVTAFQLLVAPQGQKCVSEERTCIEDNLTGTYIFSTCTTTPPGTTPMTMAMVSTFVLLIGWIVRRYGNSV